MCIIDEFTGKKIQNIAKSPEVYHISAGRATVSPGLNLL